MHLPEKMVHRAGNPHIAVKTHLPAVPRVKVTRMTLKNYTALHWWFSGRITLPHAGSAGQHFLYYQINTASPHRSQAVQTHIKMWAAGGRLFLEHSPRKMILVVPTGVPNTCAWLHCWNT